MMVDYYEILGLPREATTDDVKKAYRRLALQWHPDKNPDNLEEASRKFKQIAEAYEVLSDPGRRRTYDTRGHAPSADYSSSQNGPTGSQFHEYGNDMNGFAFTFHSAEEIFRDFFRNDPFRDFFENSMPPFFAFPPGLESLASAAFPEMRGPRARRRTIYGDPSPRRTDSRDDALRGNFMSVSTSTRIVNGKTVTTKRL